MEGLDSRTSSNGSLDKHKIPAITCASIYLSVPRPETPDSQSAHSYESNEDYISNPPNVSLALFYSIMATILCLPIGCLAIKNVIQITRDLSKGRKARANRHNGYAKNLSIAAFVVGALFWSIVGVVLIVQLVILQNPSIIEES